MTKTDPPARRHRLSTRLWHWINFACIAVLFMSGLNISNAHPYLYWGQWGFAAEDAWLSVWRFPGWSTIPGYYDLAGARAWHILMVWPFSLALLGMWIAMLANRHFWRDVATARREWRPANIKNDIAHHLRFEFHHGKGKYNFLQKFSYGAVFGLLLPLMVFTGMAISPGSDAAWGWLLDLFGGRQSARSIHFVTAWTIAAFFVVHILLVLVSGPIWQLRAMVTGRDARA